MQAPKNDLTYAAARRYGGANALSQKRELFFRQDGPTSTPAASATPASSATTNSTGGVVTSVPNVNNYLNNASSSLNATNPVSSSNSGSISNTMSSNAISTSGGISSGGISNKENAMPKEIPVRDQRNLLSSFKDMDAYVGYANLPNQVYRKAVKRGFEFTLMVVGESGLGKSTLINSMFLTDIYSNEYPGPSRRAKKTVQVETTKVLMKENGVNLKLTVVDTPGFGDAVDNSECWQPITDYIENKYEEYLNAESRVNRSTLPDSRVHCCLYFLAPSGHGLKPLDVEFMKRLHDKVNIIPLIAKADTMTPEECSMFKRTILNEIAKNKIKVYEFPDCEDEEENKMQKHLKERVPFAVVGSNTIIEVNGKRLRGRKYPWGVAEVENMEHCDFIALRNMIIRTHMQDLKDVTNNVHYENFRCRKLAGVGSDGRTPRITNKNPLAQMEEEKKEHEQKLVRMEQEMKRMFELKVREKMQKLKDSEADMQRRHEQMKKNLEAQRLELEEKWKEFEKEKTNFEAKDVDFQRIQNDSKEKKKEKKKGLF